MTENHARLPPALVETIAGLSAGTISTLAVHPLDVVKTRLQIHRNTSQTPTTSLTILRSLLSNPKPLQSLYRGLTPNLVGNASSWAIFFYFKNVIERQLLAFHSRTPLLPFSPSATAHNGGDGPRSSLSPTDYFVASGLSGILITLSTNPIWVLKTRMLSSDRGARGAYGSMWSGARTILYTEGWKGFYRGMGISLVGVGHGAVQFGVYEPLKKVWKRAFTLKHEEHEKMSNSATLLLSSAAKIVAGTVTYPYQVIRSRLQTYDAEERFGKGIRGVMRKVWDEAGARGFYRGLGANVVRVLPATWVTFLVYENVRYYLPKWFDDTQVDGQIGT